MPRGRTRRNAPPIPAHRQAEYFRDMLTDHGLISGPDDMPAEERNRLMGFNWPEEDENTGLPFLPTEMKETFIEQGTRLTVTDVRKGYSQHGNKWYIDVNLPDGHAVPDQEGVDSDAATVPFSRGDVPGRDEVFAQMREHFRSGNDPFEIVILRKGRTILLANPEDIAEATAEE